eukprot:COSAG06_NODE_360_length_16832_cov_9.250209_21_plen_108_part_00
MSGGFSIHDIVVILFQVHLPAALRQCHCVLIHLTALVGNLEQHNVFPAADVDNGSLQENCTPGWLTMSKSKDCGNPQGPRRRAGAGRPHRRGARRLKRGKMPLRVGS